MVRFWAPNHLPCGWIVSTHICWPELTHVSSCGVIDCITLNIKLCTNVIAQVLKRSDTFGQHYDTRNLIFKTIDKNFCFLQKIITYSLTEECLHLLYIRWTRKWQLKWIPLHCLYYREIIQTWVFITTELHDLHTNYCGLFSLTYIKRRFTTFTSLHSA